MMARVLKRSLTGFEAEYHLVDNSGNISNRAPEVITKAKEHDPNIAIVKEIGKNLVEFNSYPDVKTYNTALNMVDYVEKTMHVCEGMDLNLFPFANYPGRFQPELSESPLYRIKENIFGQRLLHSPRSASFHHHYTLPKSVFDNEKKELRLLKKSKLKRTLIGSYNFEIAADPVLTLLMQSSPFYQGEHFAKDARVVVYRGGRKLKFMDGFYARHQQIGGLPPYKQTATDLMQSLKRRWKRWEREVKKADPSVNFDTLYPNKLDIGWHPIKINKHGTLEQRGMDINYMSNMIAVTALLKFCLKKIQREFIEVIPADFGIEEAFKIEGDKMYIPPHTYVRNRLQYWSAYKGYNQKEMYDYAKRFYLMAKQLVPKSYNQLLSPLWDMIENKKSMSDRILSHAKYKGYMNQNRISDQDAKELTLHYTKKFPKDVELTKKRLQKISTL